MVTSANKSQPTTSLMAAALMAITPKGLRAISNSISMRPRIGKAVMEKAVPTNSAAAVRLAPGESTGVKP